MRHAPGGRLSGPEGIATTDETTSEAFPAGALAHPAATSDAAEVPRSRGATGLRQHVRVEDVLLFLWLIVQPVVLPPVSRAGPTGVDLIGGLLDVAALCGLAACLASRSRDGTRSGLVSGQDFAYAVGPLFGAVAFVIEDTGERLGLPSDLAPLPLLAAVAVGVVARWRLQPLTAEQRRALVTPFILATSGLFGTFLAGLTDIFDLRFLAASLTRAGDVTSAAFVVGLATLGVLIFYLMLVFAPRQIADRDGTTVTWALRFVLFLVSLSLGTTLGAIVHGG